MFAHLLPYCVAGLALAYFLLRPLFSSLRSVPGPFLARFTDGWYFWRLSKAAFEIENINLHKRHGPVVRYGPNRYSFDDPEASKIIYSHGTQFPKSSWYHAWSVPSEGQWNTFSEQNIKAHSLQRKQYTSTYSMTSLVSYEPYVDECADLFSQRLKEIAHTGLPIDMGYWFQCYAFDVIGLITYAKRFGFLNRGEDIGGVIAVIEDSLVYTSLVGIYAGLHWYLFRLMNLLAGSNGSGFAYVNRFTKESIEEYRANPKAMAKDTRDGNAAESFLSKFFKKHEENPQAFTSYHIQSGCASNIGAGSDTTAISLSSTLYYLLKNPQCLQKLREEIGKHESTNFTFKETQEMPYLQAVIKEALRIHPATGLPMERVVPEGGATISGRFFPEGTIVGINTWVEHRNQRIFGEDADQFRPERWLIDDADKLALMNRHWIPFGLGSRVCLGKNISMLEMCKLIPRIIRDFDFELQVGPEKKWTTRNFWFVKPKGFNVTVTLRDQKNKLSS